jgi:retinol dehydrogenase 14
MHKKIILITGSTDGIGKQTAFELSKTGATIIVHGRSEEKCKNTIREIHKSTPDADLEYLAADLSSIKEVKNLARQFHKRFSHLDVLINNAGVFMTDRKLTINGFELTFAVNHLAPFVLTNELLPLIKKSPSSRIITVSSMAHQRSTIDFENLQADHRFNGYAVYSVSKLANILHTYELAQRLKKISVTVNCLHPGVITTKLLKAGFDMEGSSLEKGAETPVYLALSDKVANVTGKYFSDKKEVRSSALSYDVSIQKKLWDVSEQLVHSIH